MNIQILNQFLSKQSLFWVNALLATTMFALPISSSAKSIFFALSLLAIVTQPDLRARFYEAFFSSFGKASLLLVLMILIAAFHGPALWSEKWMVLSKYLKLLYLPIVAVGFISKRARKYAIHAFILAMFLTSTLSFAKYFSLISGQNLDPGDVFRNHIMTGYMMAFAAFLVFWLATQSKSYQRMVYLALGLFFSIQVLFINTGRTGYVIYVFLMGLLILQILPWRKALIGLGLFLMTLMMVYEFSPMFQTKVSSVMTELSQYQANQKDTSVGYRIQFHELAKTLWMRHPILGNGSGSFTALFRIENPIPSWNNRLLEPHSLYWLFAVEFGLLGLLLLGFWFAVLIKESLNLPTLAPLALALIFPYIIGNLTDSLLFYSGSGYFFILFMGLCLGEGLSVRLYR